MDTKKSLPNHSNNSQSLFRKGSTIRYSLDQDLKSDDSILGSQAVVAYREKFQGHRSILRASYQQPLVVFGLVLSLFGLGGWTGYGDGLVENSKGQRPTLTHVVSEIQVKGVGPANGRMGVERSGQDAVALFALVPHHLGLTIQEQPTLYWYLSKPMPHPLHLTLTVHNSGRGEPVLETVLEVVPREGIHSVSLQELNIRLDLHTEYRWCVKLAVDKRHPAGNVMAKGRILRTVPHENLLDKLRNAEPEHVTAIYSEAGFWYDALASISDLSGPGAKDTITHKKEKLIQEHVDLMEIAKAEENTTVPEDSHLD